MDVIALRFKHAALNSPESSGLYYRIQICLSDETGLKRRAVHQECLLQYTTDISDQSAQKVHTDMYHTDIINKPHKQQRET